MAFPTLQPTSRDFSPGDWPIKRYNSQSGAEVRILYGSRRTNAKLSLGYDNISDSNRNNANVYTIATAITTAATTTTTI